MYENFKILQTAMERIGQIQNVKIHTTDKFWGNKVHISGITAEGSEFELELTIKETTDDRK